jgi:hypothetical protein
VRHMATVGATLGLRVGFACGVHHSEWGTLKPGYVLC